MSQVKVKAVPATPDTPLQKILAAFRAAAVAEREKGTYFEELICVYLRNEATYRDLYAKVWTYADWARTKPLPASKLQKNAQALQFHAPHQDFRLI